MCSNSSPLLADLLPTSLEYDLLPTSLEYDSGYNFIRSLAHTQNALAKKLFHTRYIDDIAWPNSIENFSETVNQI